MISSFSIGVVHDCFFEVYFVHVLDWLLYFVLQYFLRLVKTFRFVIFAHTDAMPSLGCGEFAHSIFHVLSFSLFAIQSTTTYRTLIKIKLLMLTLSFIWAFGFQKRSHGSSPPLWTYWNGQILGYGSWWPSISSCLWIRAGASWTSWSCHR